MRKRVTTSLSGIALATLAVFVVGALGADGHDGLGRFDGDVLDYFGDNPYDLIVNIAKVFDVVGEQVLLLVLSVVVGIALFSRKMPIAAAMVPFGATACSIVVVAILKDAIDRARPAVEFHLVEASSPSFPSGHTTVTTTLVVALILVLQSSSFSARFVTIAKTVAWVAAVFMGLSRLVLGVHWMSDVLASWALGTALGIAAFVVGAYAEPLVNRLVSRTDS